MSDKFEGFTPEEILNISNQKCPLNKNPSQQINAPVKKITFKQNKYGKKNMTRERMLKTFAKNSQETGVSLPQEAKLFIPQIPEEDELEDNTISNSTKEEITEFSHPSINEQSYSSEICTNNDPGTEQPCDTNGNKSSNPNISFSPTLFSPHSDGSLDEFEKRQNLIKEQNRQRKELLKKALEDRTKKTHEEARRLSQIEEELKKLDIQLSNDVSILRNQIEVASLEFMEAQKRFDRAEREYLDAKLALFTKRERKELLTGHLCTIIEQNELRKAKKLSDLMDKLHLGSIIIEKPMEPVATSVMSHQTTDKDKPTDVQV